MILSFKLEIIILLQYKNKKQKQKQKQNKNRKERKKYFRWYPLSVCGSQCLWFHHIEML